MKIPIRINTSYAWELFHALLIAFLEGSLAGCLITLGIGEITDKQVNVMTEWNTWQSFQIFFWSGTVAGVLAIRNRLRQVPVDFSKLILLVKDAEKVVVTDSSGHKETVKLDSPTDLSVQERPFK